MRIWSLHPKYLDSKGLVALWRETLLAKKVLENKTAGYKNHPQLIRFRASDDPINSLNYYLRVLHEEAEYRNYEFKVNKIGAFVEPEKIPVTKGQVLFETQHLLGKLKNRDIERFIILSDIPEPLIHPLFICIEGGLENWEKIYD